MSTEEWICPYCGFLNPYTLRVARQDICIKCKKEKTGWEQAEEEYDKQQKEIDLELGRLAQKAMPIRIEIDNLNSEIADLRVKLRRIENEYDVVCEEKKELEIKYSQLYKIQTVNGKRIAKTQTTLGGRTDELAN